MIKNRLLYTAVLMAALLFVYLYDGGVVYITLYTLLLLPAVSYVLAYASRWALDISQSISASQILKGDEIVYTLTIRNKSVFAFGNISFAFYAGNIAVEADTRPVTVQLAPRATVGVPITMRCRYRGTYDIGLKNIELFDFLGLFRFKRRVNGKLSVTISPRVAELRGLPLATNLLSKAHSNFEIREEDYTTVMDVRKYEPTDSYKKIHWKLSAKKNDLIVKNFQSTVLNSTMILLDTRGNSVSKTDGELILEDKLLEVFVAVAGFCLKNQLPVEAVLGGGFSHTARGAAGFDELYAIAAGLVFEETAGPEAFLHEYTVDQSSYINIVILTAGLNELLYESAVGARHFGHHVTLVHVKGGYGTKTEAASERIFNKLSEAGIDCFAVNADGELDEVF